MRTVALVLTSLVFLARPGLTGEPFRRIVYEQTVPLGAEAPGVALSGDIVAYSTSSTLRVVDIRTGRELFSGPPVPGGGERPADSVHIFGIIDGKLYARARRSDIPPDDPAGNVATMHLGPRRGQIDVAVLDIEAGRVEVLLRLPMTALVADNLLGDNLVYAQGRRLCMVSLAGGGERTFDLGDDAGRRPVVSGGRVFGLCAGLAYVYRQGDADLTRVRYRGTALASIAIGGDITAGIAGDLIVAGTGSQVIACDTEGKLRWRVPAPGFVFTGSGGEIFASYGATRRLAPEDGRTIWCNCQPCGFFGERAAVVSGKMLALFSERMLTVLDSRTGKVVMNMPLKMGSRREVSTGDATYFRASTSGRLIAIGFDEWVKVIDTTPTGDVPEGSKRSDPANALGKLGSLAALRAHEAHWLARDLADTPEAAARMLPVLQARVGRKGRRADAELFVASSWIDDSVIAEGLLQAVGTLDGQRRHCAPVVMALASLPDRDRARSALEEITKDRDTYGTQMRKWAAMQLTWLGKAAGPAGAGLRLLFSADHDAITAEFRRRLRDGDAKVRAAALKLLGMAPDAVIVGLEEEVAGLPEEDLQEEGRDLVRQAKGRIAAIERYGRR